MHAVRRLGAWLTAAVVATGIVLAAPVRAEPDEAGFLDEVRAAGEWGGALLNTDDQLLNAGYRACAIFREGRGVRAFADSLTYPIEKTIAWSAHHHLCPDTAE